MSRVWFFFFCMSYKIIEIACFCYKYFTTYTDTKTHGICTRRNGRLLFSKKEKKSNKFLSSVILRLVNRSALTLNSNRNNNKNRQCLLFCWHFVSLFASLLTFLKQNFLSTYLRNYFSSFSNHFFFFDNSTER